MIKQPYVFVSYSSQNRDKADCIRKILMNAEISVWMAPYDLPGGSQYAKEINQAIKHCHCFLLLVTNQSIESIWVQKETERAICARKVIIPVELEDTILNDEFEFYISSNHIIKISELDSDSLDVRNLLDAIMQYVETGTETVKAYFDKGMDYFIGDNGQSQNFEEAVKWFRKAAAKGHQDAQLHLGYCYGAGYGVEQDYVQAVRWLKKAAQQGDMYAQFSLGHILYADHSEVQDKTEAVKWFFYAAEQGLADAQYIIGVCYEEGEVLPQNMTEAQKWYQKAAVQGNEDAKSKLI